MKNIIDELIIVDDYSTDNTIKIIKSIYPKVKIYKRKLNHNFAAQRNFALGKVSNKWVLMIDSDEVLTEELKKQIIQTLKDPKYKAYTSRRDNFAFEKYYKSTSGRPILLKNNIRFRGSLHEDVVGVKKGHLDKPLLHNKWTNFKDWLDDVNRYSTWNALKWYREKRDYNILHLLLIGTVMPIYTFLEMYFKRGKWRGGVVGFLYSMACGSEWIFTTLKFYELKYLGEKRE